MWVGALLDAQQEGGDIVGRGVQEAARLVVGHREGEQVDGGELRLLGRGHEDEGGLLDLARVRVRFRVRVRVRVWVRVRVGVGVRVRVS